MSLTDITVISLVAIELIRLSVYIWQVTHEPTTDTLDDFRWYLEKDTKEPVEKRGNVKTRNNRGNTVKKELSNDKHEGREVDKPAKRKIPTVGKRRPVAIKDRKASDKLPSDTKSYPVRKRPPTVRLGQQDKQRIGLSGESTNFNGRQLQVRKPTGSKVRGRRQGESPLRGDDK